MSTTKLLLDYDYDFFLVGILSTVPDYKLCWGMNRALKLNLNREKDLELLLQNHEESSDLLLSFDNPELLHQFSKFGFYDEATHVQYTVVANKSNSRLLIREEQSVDYFLVVDGLYGDSNLEENIIKKLREQKEIVTAYMIDPNTLKSKQNLIFE